MDLDLLAQHAVQLLLVNVALWVLSLILGKTWPVDFIWLSWPIYAAFDAVSRVDGDWTTRQIAVLALVTVWGLRLTLNFISRGGIGHEDWRYTNMRTQFGSAFWIACSCPV